MDSCLDIEPSAPRRSTRHAIFSGVLATLVSLASMPAMAVPLSVSFDGTLTDDQRSPISLSFDFDTAAVAGTFRTGSCRLGGGTVSNVYTDYRVSGGVSNAQLSVEGLGSDTALSSANFRYYFDVGDICKFHMGFDMNFASGLSVRSDLQFSPIPYYSTLTTSLSDLVAQSFIDAYGPIDIIAGSVSYQGTFIENILTSRSQINSQVPEPSTLMLFGLALSGLLLSSTRHRFGAWRERLRSVFRQP